MFAKICIEMALLDRKKWLLKTEASNTSLYSHIDVDKNGNLDDKEMNLVVK